MQYFAHHNAVHSTEINIQVALAFLAIIIVVALVMARKSQK